jgi:hypothetical protein
MNIRTQRTIKATPNHSARTYTLRTGTAKYRTIRMSKYEFNNCLYNTSNDWEQFLKTDEYYVVK